VNIERTKVLAAFSVLTLASLSYAELKVANVTTTRTVPNATVFNNVTNNGASAVRVEMFDKMVGSTEVFSFDDEAHLIQHISVREKIMEVMALMGNAGGINFTYYNVVNNPPVFPAGFEVKDPNNRQKPYEFKQSNAQAASAAVQAIETGLPRVSAYAPLMPQFSSRIGVFMGILGSMRK
jgi:hypothetical protein